MNVTPGNDLCGLIRQSLRQHLSKIIAGVVIANVCEHSGITKEHISAADMPRLIQDIEHSLSYYLDAGTVALAVKNLQNLDLTPHRSVNYPPKKEVITVHSENDVRDARIKALELAKAIGLEHADAVKLATVASELTRNILQYTKGGCLELESVCDPRVGVKLVAEDGGPGIADVDHVLGGEYRSETGLGLGLKGSKQMMDEFDIKTCNKGTVISAIKYQRRRRGLHQAP